MRKKTFCLLLGLLVFVAATGLLEARPIKIQKITKASQFKRRQSPRLVIKPIDLKPLDLVGGMNLAAAKKAVNEAIKKVEGEIKDQQTLLKGYKQRVTKMNQRIDALKKDKASLVAQRDSIKEELTVLQGISSPSQPILDCIAELEGDLAQANEQIANCDKAIKTLTNRINFVKKVGAGAAKNLKRLQTALGHLKNASKSLGFIKLETVKPEWTKNLRLLAPRKGKKRGR